MNDNNGLALVAPRITPLLDSSFRPAVLAYRAFHNGVRASKTPVQIQLALEQTDGPVFHLATEIFPENHPESAGNFTYLERLVKFLLWSRGGWRIYFDGPATLAAKLAAHYRDAATGKFDSNMVAERMFDHSLEVVNTKNIPP